MARMQRQQAADMTLSAPFDPQAPGVELITEPGPATVVHSTRLPAQYSKALEAEADARGVSPSKLMQIFIIAALEESDQGDMVHIPRQRLLKALEQAVNDAA